MGERESAPLGVLSDYLTDVLVDIKVRLHATLTFWQPISNGSKQRGKTASAPSWWKPR
jgi:hypothetical protein